WPLATNGAYSALVTGVRPRWKPESVAAAPTSTVAGTRGQAIAMRRSTRVVDLAEDVAERALELVRVGEPQDKGKLEPPLRVPAFAHRGGEQAHLVSRAECPTRLEARPAVLEG